MDRRLWPATARAAHTSLQGRISGVVFTDGQETEIAAPLANLRSSPDGARERQLLHGDAFCIIDTAGSHAFGFARKDGYCGWIAQADLQPARVKTHWLAAPSHLYPAPRVQAQPLMPLPFGARVQVLGQSGNFANTDQGYVPLPHLRALGDWADDPVAVAETFLHCPYLWGGNSHAGLDCSGLVQAALLACGSAAGADSDLQQVLGEELAAQATLARGDLLFWRGHVAMAVDSTRLIHANGHAMSVAYEDISPCISRIADAGGGGVIHRRRIAR
ncbi:MAG: NlpC/P60 family protein [Cypionkella sp.]